MSIATSIKKSAQAPEERNETSKLLRSSGALKLNKPCVYKHFIPTGCVPETLQQEHFVDVDFEVDLKKRSLTVDGKLYDEVRAIAKNRRIPADKLVSRWIKEKLRSAA